MWWWSAQRTYYEIYDHHVEPPLIFRHLEYVYSMFKITMRFGFELYLGFQFNKFSLQINIIICSRYCNYWQSYYYILFDSEILTIFLSWKTLRTFQLRERFKNSQRLREPIVVRENPSPTRSEISGVFFTPLPFRVLFLLKLKFGIQKAIKNKTKNTLRP